MSFIVIFWSSLLFCCHSLFTFVSSKSHQKITLPHCFNPHELNSSLNAVIVAVTF